MMSPKDYVEAVALELTKLRGRGLLLSPADASLALSWHAAEVPLQAVLGEIRRGVRLQSKGRGVRGATEIGLTLQALAPSIEVRAKARHEPRRPEASLSTELLRACRQDLPARQAWLELALAAEDLIAHSAEAYWTAMIGALRETLRALPRAAVRKISAALRERMAPRPAGMPLARYKRTLQLMLLSTASQELGVPPKAFLL